MHEPLHVHWVREFSHRAGLRAEYFHFIQLRAVEAADNVDPLLIWGCNGGHRVRSAGGVPPVP